MTSEDVGSDGERPALRFRGKQCLIVEDHPVVASQEVRVLSAAGASCSVAVTLREARALVERHRWDLLLMDLHLADGTTAELTREVLGRRVSTGVVVFSGYLEPQASLELYRLGAVPVHKEELRVADLLTMAEFAMARAARIRRAPSPPLEGRSVRKCSASAEFCRSSRFSRRERDVFELILSGIAPKEIANRLGTAPATVRRQIQDMCFKCHVDSQRELLALFARAVIAEEATLQAAVGSGRPTKPA